MWKNLSTLDFIMWWIFPSHNIAMASATRFDCCSVVALASDCTSEMIKERLSVFACLSFSVVCDLHPAPWLIISVALDEWRFLCWRLLFGTLKPLLVLPPGTCWGQSVSSLVAIFQDHLNLWPGYCLASLVCGLHIMASWRTSTEHLL